MTGNLRVIRVLPEFDRPPVSDARQSGPRLGRLPHAGLDAGPGRSGARLAGAPAPAAPAGAGAGVRAGDLGAGRPAERRQTCAVWRTDAGLGSQRSDLSAHPGSAGRQVREGGGTQGGKAG